MAVAFPLCPSCQVSHSPDGMSDAEFSEFISKSHAAFSQKQPSFAATCSQASSWSYNLSQCVLLLGNISYPITPIGSFSAKYQSWLWAWANPEFPPQSVEASKLLQGLLSHTGFRIFVTPGVPANASEANNLVVMSLQHLNAMGLFTCPGSSGEPSLFLAVHAPGKDMPN